MFKKIDSNFLGKFVKVFVLVAVLVGGFGVKDSKAIDCVIEGMNRMWPGGTDCESYGNGVTWSCTATSCTLSGDLNLVTKTNESTVGVVIQNFMSADYKDLYINSNITISSTRTPGTALSISGKWGDIYINGDIVANRDGYGSVRGIEIGDIDSDGEFNDFGNIYLKGDITLNGYDSTAQAVYIPATYGHTVDNLYAIGDITINMAATYPGHVTPFNFNVTNIGNIVLLSSLLGDINENVNRTSYFGAYLDNVTYTSSCFSGFNITSPGYNYYEVGGGTEAGLSECCSAGSYYDWQGNSGSVGCTACAGSWNKDTSSCTVTCDPASDPNGGNEEEPNCDGSCDSGFVLQPASGYDPAICVCPSGEEWNGSACVVPCNPATDPNGGYEEEPNCDGSCDSGFILQPASGYDPAMCVCPSGEVWSGSACVPACSDAGKGAFGQAIKCDGSCNSGLTNSGGVCGCSAGKEASGSCATCLADTYRAGWSSIVEACNACPVGSSSPAGSDSSSDCVSYISCSEGYVEDSSDGSCYAECVGLRQNEVCFNGISLLADESLSFLIDPRVAGTTTPSVQECLEAGSIRYIPSTKPGLSGFDPDLGKRFMLECTDMVEYDDLNEYQN